MDDVATAPTPEDNADGAPAAPPLRRHRGATRRHTLIAGGVALVVAAGAAGFALPHSSRPASRTAVLASKSSAAAEPGAEITVTGAATVEGTPDTVSFQIGVHSTAATATGALAHNNSQVARLEAALEAHGVTASEMQTSQLDIYANTNKYGNVTGFSVDDDLDVTMHAVDEAGSALDAAAGAVGNGVTLYGISFSISNTSGLLATARGEAMLNARTEASQLATGAGLTLGAIVKVTDEENAQPTYYYGGDLAQAASAAAVPLQAGSQPISVQVSVVYALQG
jgi:uncharacterized protein YggE